MPGKPILEELTLDWSPPSTSCLLLDRPNLCGRHIGRLPSLDQLDADADHTGGSSYYLSRRRRPPVRP